jgi:hypothetical protein
MAEFKMNANQYLNNCELAWEKELESFLEEYDNDLFEELLCDIELPDELALYRLLAEQTPDFDDKLCEWLDFVFSLDISILLEQSCEGALLLPSEMAFERIKTAPKRMLHGYERFMKNCPLQVKHHIAYIIYHFVRSLRGRVSDLPVWRPPLLVK